MSSVDSDSDEGIRLLEETSDNGGDAPSGLARSQALNLYVSHAFSTWNARGYEFAAVRMLEERLHMTLLADEEIRSSLRRPPIQIPS